MKRDSRETMEPTLSYAEEQDKWLADAMTVVKAQAQYMKRALDANNMREALKFSAQMLSELRTSKLSPQKYYELYMRTFDELRFLELFFQEESRRGRSNADIYEMVQHAGNILPRLYLLCTVGSVYIKSKEAPAKEVLKDLVEMSRGVQHPIRGLFLRSYLSQISKDKLPDVGSEYEGEGGNVTDAVEFVLQNFTEMNKLWVRMQHQGQPREKEKREKERSELRDLVGKNLHVLSQLEGVDLEMYQATVLPRVLEQVVNCKDEIAQYYLMDCIIQVFPDEYHLQTLETLLGACPQLQPSVDVKTIMSQLMDRISNYAAQSPQALPEFLQVDAFNKLSTAVAKVVEAQPDMPLVGAVNLHVALLGFVLRVYSDRLDFVDQVLASCVKVLDARSHAKDAAATKQVVALLSAPLEKYNDVVTVLRLGSYPRAMEHLDRDTNRVMAVVVIQSVLRHQTYVREPDKVELLFQLLQEVVRDAGDAQGGEELDEEDFREEQNLVARLVHMLVNDDPDTQFQILSIARRHLGQGGPSRVVHTLPPVVFAALKLIRVVAAREAAELADEGDAEGEGAAAGGVGGAGGGSGGEAPVTTLKIFQFLNKAIEALTLCAPELAVRLYLQCAEAAGDCGQEPVAYDFFTQAFVIYEEDISDSKAQITAIHLIIGTLQRSGVFGAENRDTLTHKATGYSAKLLKKPDQCRAVYACAHLFWSADEHGVRDGDRVVLCLKRAQKIANAAQQMSSATRGTAGPVTLFVEILNKYLYFFDQGAPQVTPAVIQSLLELIKTEMQSESTAQDSAVDQLYENTLRFVREQKQKGGHIGELYESLQL